MSKDPIIIVGGGLGGLSAAISLLSQGEKVLLYEKHENLGGKANTKVIGEYRFDTGPSLLTLVKVFEDLFTLCGKNVYDYIPIVPLSPITHYWFSDGTHFTSDTIEKFTPTLTSHLEVTQKEVDSYISYSKKIWDLTHEIFLMKSLHSSSTYFNKKTFLSFMQLLKIDPLRSMHKANSSYFRDNKMVQLLDRYATYNGSDPYQAPATLNNIVYAEHGLGGYGVKNGIYGIVEGMAKLFYELGGVAYTQTKVERITYDNKRNITGIVVNGQEVKSKTVFSDVDTLTLYETLLQDEKAPIAKRYRSLPSSSSALVFYFGVHKEFKELGIHNIFFSDDYKKEFTEIHTLHKIPEDPTIYINITSKITPTDAPVGGENWFVLVNAPPYTGDNFEIEIERTRLTVIKKLSNILKVDLNKYIESDGILTPKMIEEETNSYQGALYGISSNTLMAAFLRHRNQSKRYKGLYHCGGSVHPGGGMPLATLSGMISSELYKKRGF
ncbi:MAG: phytoene desaturase [Spirochaetia bacterium]|nr:phytoene desaturase [Spirochaetia bacterium]